VTFLGTIGARLWGTRRGNVKTIVLPTEYAERARRRFERESIRKARSKYGIQKFDPDNPYANKFIAWDGEGPKDAGYALFGNSEGDEICDPFLSTLDCFQLLLEAATKYNGAIHIWFGANYDVSNILKDLSIRCLVALHNNNKCIWGEYQIKHIPHKWFEVKHGSRRIILYDIHSFFGCSYTDALDEFGMGSFGEMGEIRSGKAKREDFLWEDIDYIKSYFRAELRLMPILADKLRDAFSDAGYMPKAWYGPGAIARLALRRHKIHEAMGQCPLAVRLAALYAFAAGRFEGFLAGHANRECWIADIHSAYPYFAATQLPNLAKGKWRKTKTFEKGKFGVYNIRYEAPLSNRPYPLFRRMENGEVAWPYRVTGWYWTPEAELVANDKYAKFIEGWIFDESDISDRPFAWLADYYDKRLRLKRMGNAAQYTFKLILNSVYGQLAQRSGWNKRRCIAPTYHQIEWAGYITSACRAAVYKVALSCRENLVSIDTDGITSLAPFEGIAIGDKLGEWEVTHYDDGIFWQSGIYALKTNNCRDKRCHNYRGMSNICGHEWPTNKTRGIPKNSYSHKLLLDCLATGKTLELVQNTFITYTQALIGENFKEKVNTWVKVPHSYKMGGNGKRIHNEKYCKNVCIRKDGLHVLTPVHLKYGPFGKSTSVIHYVPWIKEAQKMKEMKNQIDSMTIFTEESDEWEWVTQ
jgi:hypothetical protein